MLIQRFSHLLLLVSLVAALLAVALFPFASMDLLTKVTDLTGPSADPKGDSDFDQLMRGVHYVVTNGANKEWELWADRAEALRQQDTWRLKKVKFTFYNEQQEALSVFGDFARIEMEKNDLEVFGNVLILMASGDRARTDRLVYRSKNRELISETEVSFLRDGRGQNARLVSGAMTVSVEEQRVLLHQAVRGFFEVENDKYSLRAQRSFIDSSRNAVDFIGTVEFQGWGYTFSAPEATLRFHEKPYRELKAGALFGGVVGEGLGRKLQAERLEFHIDKGTLELRGNPRIEEEGKILNGDLILFKDRGETVVVKSARARKGEVYE